ncbi:hypothetical protein [Photobacterium ganghwense]|uniref:Uncharacterized protein n=1 Tax=Photobacterium ganghwense TaxID=320778 RepID=A0A0J1HEY9_9GAMM|nr:hypothetical protein [Photobacterium ganghwense]KLV10190.1 hypothetical protein ABT57_06330 [Photobacterium ganghwense]PSU05439.1 hypothetical protein C9I92_21880 [Photobacterium ganghwense]QSV17185.1 hypothetical protein FH974_19800 [Photobacterium ganghwense]
MAIDLGFYFSRLIHHYNLSYSEVLALPIRTFWMMSRNVDRHRAEMDISQLRLLRASQTSEEHLKDFAESLTEQLSSPIEIKRSLEDAEPDADAIDRLKSLLGNAISER